MSKIDSLLFRALEVYNRSRHGENGDELIRRKLSQLELEIQGLLQKEPIILKPIKIHDKAGRLVSPKKLAYCFSNFPLKFSSFEEGDDVSAFDMINVVSCFITHVQRFERRKIFGAYNGNFLGPAIIHQKISKSSLKDLFFCEENEGTYKWNFYIPVVFSGEQWDERQPEENFESEKFFIDHRLFEVSNIGEIKEFSYWRSGGVVCGKKNYVVYFGDSLIAEMEALKYLP